MTNTLAILRYKIISSRKIHRVDAKEIADHLADSDFNFLRRMIEQCVGDDAEMLVEEIDALNGTILPPASAPEYLARLMHAVRRRAA